LAGHGVQPGAADVVDAAESGRTRAGITIPSTLDRVRPIDSRPSSFPCRVAHQRPGGQGGNRLLPWIKYENQRAVTLAARPFELLEFKLLACFEYRTEADIAVNFLGDVGQLKLELQQSKY
jgi:hypothetical protein